MIIINIVRNLNFEKYYQDFLKVYQEEYFVLRKWLDFLLEEKLK